MVMPVFKILCDPDVAQSLVAHFTTLENLLPADKRDRFRWEVDMKMAKIRDDDEKAVRVNKPIGPRVEYQPILPTAKKARAEAIAANLRNLHGQMAGVVYQEIINAAERKERITKPIIMDRCKIPVASTAERVIGDLGRMKLIQSVPIVVPGQ
jgi:hypothetical protein